MVRTDLRSLLSMLPLQLQAGQKSRSLEVLYVLFLLQQRKAEDGGKKAQATRFDTIEECLNAEPVLSIQAIVNLTILGVIKRPAVEVLVRIGGKPLTAYSEIFTLDRGYEAGLYEAEILSFKNQHTPKGSGHKELSRTYHFLADAQAMLDFIDQEISLWAQNQTVTSSGASLYDSAVQLIAFLKDIEQSLTKNTNKSFTIEETRNDARMEKIMAALWLQKRGVVKIKNILWKNRIEGIKPNGYGGYCPSLRMELEHWFFQQFPKFPITENEDKLRLKIAEMMGNSWNVRITSSGEWIAQKRYKPREGSFPCLLARLLAERKTLTIPWRDILAAQDKKIPEPGMKMPESITKDLSNLKRQLQDYFPHLPTGTTIRIKGTNLVLDPAMFFFEED